MTLPIYIVIQNCRGIDEPGGTYEKALGIIDMILGVTLVTIGSLHLHCLPSAASYCLFGDGIGIGVIYLLVIAGKSIKARVD